jgi:hypothetical protein
MPAQPFARLWYPRHDLDFMHSYWGVGAPVSDNGAIQDTITVEEHSLALQEFAG